MKKNIPFKKEIIFKDNVAEITSISLEHNLNKKENSVYGEFIISGEYKINQTSINTEPFFYELPFEISLDERYILKDARITIDDFYYEIVNDKILIINIEILIDKLEEKEIIIQEDTRENFDIQNNITEIKSQEIIQPRCIEKEDLFDNPIFNSLSDNDTYKSYSVYIIRENDTIESIIEKYEVDLEQLELYNDLKEIKLGDKIIIPSND
ncbi:MAG: LysM peptidoglycan-binding domain-containing protein [Bacilli bacterium]|nr:LysM peptidoglycan-binding domain-containing protein [Bacilli bacterium]